MEKDARNPTRGGLPCVSISMSLDQPQLLLQWCPWESHPLKSTLTVHVFKFQGVVCQLRDVVDQYELQRLPLPAVLAVYVAEEEEVADHHNGEGDEEARKEHTMTKTVVHQQAAAMFEQHRGCMDIPPQKHREKREVSLVCVCVCVPLPIN